VRGFSLALRPLFGHLGAVAGDLAGISEKIYYFSTYSGSK